MTRLCAVVLAAGEGTRLRPLTDTRPKALCPVGNVALLDRALIRLARHGLSGPDQVAVNACYLADQVVEHVRGRAYCSVEPGPPALGTAGAVAKLRAWIDDRAVLVINADAYLDPDQPDAADLAPLWNGWTGETVRVLGVLAGAAGDGRPAEFGAARFAGASLLPASSVASLPPGRSELVREVWRPAERQDRLEVVRYQGFYLDTGTVGDYLAANLHAARDGSLVAGDAVVSGQVTHSVIGAGARVDGSVVRSVVLPHAVVGPEERLVDAVRDGSDLTLTPALTGPSG
ncbi:MAG TPA: sugar phosphate nucleotidyltransferase [Micromonosporaceae bacterium]